MTDNSANYPPVLKRLIAKRMERAKTHEPKMAKAMTKTEMKGTYPTLTPEEKAPLKQVPKMPAVKSKLGKLKSVLKNKGSDTHSLDPHADGGDDGW